MRIVRPWLPSAHPNFFVIYAFTTTAHLWYGYNGVFGSDRDFSSPTFVHVNQFASHGMWGYWQGAVGVALALALFLPTFTAARVALAMGLTATTVRLLLFGVAWSDGIPVGNTMPNVLLICGLLLSQTLEPPHNPASER